MGSRFTARFVALVALFAMTSAVLPPPLAAAAERRPAQRDATTARDGDASSGDVAELRTATSRTRRNDDGTFTTSMYTTPVNYADRHGRWHPIDSSLVATSEDGYAWRNAANSFNVLFKEALESDFMRFEAAGEAFTFTLEGAGRRPASAKGPRISYLDALSGVDLTYEVIPEGVKEKLVLDNAGVPAHYRFLVEPEGDVDLDVVEQDDGSWAFYVPTHHGPAFVLGAPRALDAAQQGSVAPTAKPNASMKVTKTGDAFAIDVNLDAKWLHDPAREFPVVLDPSITIQPSVEDATFVGNCPSCAPILDERLYIGTDKWYAYRAALKYDIGDVPVGANVTSANVVLVYDGWCIAGGPSLPHCGGLSHKIDAHRITGNWTTASTTSQATFDPAVLSSYTLPANPGVEDRRMSWNVTGTVTSWIAGTQPNYGIMLKRDVEYKDVSGPVPPGRRYAYEPTLRPTLEVTWSGDGVQLHEPTELYANGAELSWDRYTGPSGAPFDRYEVHRSSSRRFTPSSSTLLATIRDPAVTTYRDTTAAPNKTFTYKVVANSSVSNERTVTLPATGEAKVTLQPGAEDGKATDVTYSSQVVNCANYGADDWVYVGTTSTTKSRPLLGFELKDVPPKATITNATMSLWTYSVPMSGTVRAYGVTGEWQEGTGNTECTGDGATWYETEAGVDWVRDGGDFESGAAASVSFTAQDESSWHNFNLTSLVQRWVDADTPNLGVLLKLDDERLLSTNWFSYYSDDYTVVPTLRPKLVVTYKDPASKATGPTVAIGAPGAGSTVSGTAVKIAASATDDRRVDKVEFLVDGVVKATDTTLPFETTWDSTTVANGAHTIAARATDDAGNVTTSANTNVTVRNSAKPTTSVSSPVGGATVAGTATVTANAADDVGVERVEFLFDDFPFATDTTAPYSVSWNTLDANLPAYDGSHVLTTRAYDSDGQVTTSAPVTVTVNNRTTTKYKATLTSSAYPLTVDYDPAATTQRSYGVNVTVRNDSAVTWSATDIELRYRWISPDATPVYTNSAATQLGVSLAPGATVTKTMLVKAPTLAAGVDKAQYRLRFDLREASTATWFASKGNKPLENPVIVNKIVMSGLGIERYYHYSPERLGAGMSQLTNVASGNNVLQWTPFMSPGRGLSTVVDLAYNSLEKKGESPIGNNFSLSISSLVRFGSQLDVHPNKADDIAGNANRYVEFTDGDGTTHRFIGKQAADGTVYWEEPAGVHLYLREYSATDTARKWALTRPDGATFFFDVDGFPTFVRDKNGNELSFTLQTTPAGEDPGGPKKRITAITDAAGQGLTPAPNRKFTIDYYSKAEAKKAHVRGNIESITDHNGSVLYFDYYDDGNLLRITQRGGTKADGSFLSDRSFVFTYTTSDGSGPAIPLAADRVDPNPKTPNQSSVLYSVRDPRGAETTFTYYGPTSAQLRWKLESVTNRAGEKTSFAYDITNRVTTENAPLSRATKYAYDTEGKVTGITNPKNEVTQLTWNADRKVERVTEPTGKFTEYRYNANGYLTDFWDQLRNHTRLTYLNRAVDANDVTGKWKTGRTIPHLSFLETKTDPKGMATTTVAGDFQWVFAYDAKGNMTSATDPENGKTSFVYNADGTIQSSTNPRNNVTNYAYDANGLPTKITQVFADPSKTRVTQFGYDDDGLLRWVQDANHETYSGGDPRHYRTYFDYDSFHRLGRQSAPKSTQHDRGVLIWSAVDYDPNDNVTTQIAPHYGEQYTGGGSKTTIAYDAMDRQTLVTGPDISADPAGERTKYVYDGAGRPVEVVLPKGVKSSVDKDHTIFLDYDPIDRVIRRTQHEVDDAGVITETQTTHFCYDLAGDLVSVTSPRANAATIDCAAPPSFTKKFVYDDAHRLKSQKDALGHEKTIDYDANSNVIAATSVDGLGGTDDLTTRREYDERNMVVKIIEPLTATRSVTTKYEYDAAGNIKRKISPRAWDASADKTTFSQYVTSYEYNEADELTKILLPTSTQYPQQQYVHRDYDKNGNLTMSSIGTAKASAGELQPNEKTTVTYFDPGWVRTQNDPGNPAVHFDYYAEGWQMDRIPQGDGELDGAKRIHWEYFPDGAVKVATDLDDQRTTFDYDANNNLVKAHDSGVTSDNEKPVDVEATWDDYDRVAKVRHQKEGASDWTFTTYKYDKNANVIERVEDGKEGATGVTEQGRRHDLTYDAADWLVNQVDHGKKSGTDDDQKIDNSFFPTGWEKERVVHERDAAGTWSVQERTTWEYFLNGKLKRLVTKNENGAVVESHDVDYIDNGLYVNGNRVKDVFVRKRPTAGSCTDAASPCTATYTYDPRDRVRAYTVKTAAGSTITNTSYDLDAAGNITTETDNGVTRSYTYDGTQLKTMTQSGFTFEYWYDDGNLDCITEVAGSDLDCGTAEGEAPSANVVSEYSYDYLSRLTSKQTFDVATSAEEDESSYVYDPLGRVTRQEESHDGSSPKTKLYSYLGLTNLMTQEDHKNSSGSLLTTKTYAYDAYGHRISMTDDPQNDTQGPKTYTYAYDVHGSVSMLLDESGGTKASYGYKPYGAEDDQLSAGDRLSDAQQSNTELLNPFRYTGRRYDTGSDTFDMGARRFGPDVSRFLQQDVLYSAVGNLSLSMDPLTQNRFALAGGNPVSFVEWDGHMLMADGGGGGTSDPNPDESTSSWSSNLESEASGGGDSGGSGWTDWLPDAGEIARTAASIAADWAEDAFGQRAEQTVRDIRNFADNLDDALDRVPGLRRYADAAERGLNQAADFAGRHADTIGKVAKAGGGVLDVVDAALAFDQYQDYRKEGKSELEAGVRTVGPMAASTGVGAAVTGVCLGGTLGIGSVGCAALGAGAGALAGKATEKFLDWGFGGGFQDVANFAGDVKDTVSGGLEDAGNWVSDHVPDISMPDVDIGLPDFGL